MSESPLLTLAEQLYALPLADFTAARDAAAKAEADKSLKSRIKALKKAAIAGWAVNLLVRREADQIDQVLTLGESLRLAAEAMDGEELRSLTRQRRQLTTALATTAARLAREEQVKLTSSVIDQVEAMLNAAMLDPDAAAVVRSGMVLTAFTSTGVGRLDVAALVAIPEAIGHRAAPAQAAAHEPPQLRVVPDSLEVRRARAQEALDTAQAVLDDAESTHGEVARALAELNARRLQLADERDAWRRRLAEVEEAMDAVEDDLDECQAETDEALLEVAEATKTRDRARDALAELD